MISDERLEQLADDNIICKVSWDERVSMAAELLTLRKAFSQHAAWMAEDGNVYGPADFEGDLASMDLTAKCGGFEPLYKNPTVNKTN